MVVVYIIHCVGGSFYTGITGNLPVRWSQHLTGKCRYTRHNKPINIIHKQYYPCYKSARRVERYIKSIGAKRYLLSTGIQLHQLT